MKELDILLVAFVERYQGELEAGQWAGFESLLSYEDDVLWDCIQDPASPEAAAHKGLLTAIREIRA